MPYRLAARAQNEIDRILLESAQKHGFIIAGRYGRLILAAVSALGDDPRIAGSRELTSLPGIKALHLRYARRLVPPEHRITTPRHLIVYRTANTDLVEILGLAHDRMELTKAARKARRAADQT